MDETGSGGAAGPGGPSGRVPTSVLDEPVTRADILAARGYNTKQLEALIKRIVRTPGGIDLTPLLTLPPKSIAFLVTTNEWQDILDTMAAYAVIDRKDRYTRSQWKAIFYFKTRVANGGGPSKKLPKGIRVEASDELDRDDE